MTLLTTIALLASANTAAAATLDVCASCTYTSIQDALDASANGDEVLLMGGTFSEAIEISTEITLAGDWGTTNVIDGYGLAVPVLVKVSADDVVIRNIEITNFGYDSGGCQLDNEDLKAAVRVGAGHELRMQFSAVTNNCAYVAPIHNYGFLALSSETEVSGNRGNFAGGVFNRGVLFSWDNGNDYSFSMSDNWGAVSGGIYSNDISAPGYTPGTYVRNARFSGNTSMSHGGALTALDEPLLIEDTTFSDNLAHTYSGGAWYYGGADTVTRSGNTYSGNDASNDASSDNYHDANTGSKN